MSGDCEVSKSTFQSGGCPREYVTIGRELRAAVYLYVAEVLDATGILDLDNHYIHALCYKICTPRLYDFGWKTGRKSFTKNQTAFQPCNIDEQTR